MAAIGADQTVLEIGAGLGTLTRALSGVARHVVAVEFDRALIPALEEAIAGARNVEILHADAMDLEYSKLLPPGSKMVSNLPYNVATPLMAKLLEEAADVTSFLIMIQKEVAQRLVAAPGSRTYGAISVRVAYHCDARILGTVPASVFWPAPKVASALVEMDRVPARVEVPSETLMQVVRAAFSQRRKTVRNSLATLFDEDAIERALTRAGIDPEARAETLDLQQFADLSRELR